MRYLNGAYLIYSSTLDLLLMPLVNENKWEGVRRKVEWSLMIELKLDFKWKRRRYIKTQSETMESDDVDQLKMAQLTLNTNGAAYIKVWANK